MKHLFTILSLVLALQFLQVRAQVLSGGDVVLKQDFSTLSMRISSDLAAVTESTDNADIADGKVSIGVNGYYIINNIPLHNVASLELQLSPQFQNSEIKVYCFYAFDGSTDYREWNSAYPYGELSCYDSDNNKCHSSVSLKFRPQSAKTISLDCITLKAASVNETYTRDVTPDNLGTVCLPSEVKNVTGCGATIYKIAGKRMSDGEVKSIVFEEATSLGAGEPCVFLAHEGTLTLKMSGAGANEPCHVNGLYGVFDRHAFADDAEFSLGDYCIVNSKNQIQVASDKSGVVANRAFIKLSEVPVYDESAQAPGTKLLVLDSVGYSAEEVESTGIETIAACPSPSVSYDLQGFIASGSGLLVRNGKVVLRK